VPDPVSSRRPDTQHSPRVWGQLRHRFHAGGRRAFAAMSVGSMTTYTAALHIFRRPKSHRIRWTIEFQVVFGNDGGEVRRNNRVFEAV
jgi:hypothetical protein